MFRALARIFLCHDLTLRRSSNYLGCGFTTLSNWRVRNFPLGEILSQIHRWTLHARKADKTTARRIFYLKSVLRKPRPSGK